MNALVLLSLPVGLSDLSVGLALVCLLGYGIVAVPDRLWSLIPKRLLVGLGLASSLALAYVIIIDCDYVICCLGVICCFQWICW